jgi:hypothetical protein
MGEIVIAICAAVVILGCAAIAVIAGYALGDMLFGHLRSPAPPAHQDKSDTTISKA